MNRLAWTMSVWASRLRHTAIYAVALPFTYRNWWAVPLAKLGRSGVLELRNGTRYHVRPHSMDLAAVNEAAILNPYLRSQDIVLDDDATIVDVGAYIGDFTIQAARACPRGRVVAVEPVASNVQMIEKQISLNRVSNVQVIEAELGDADRDTPRTLTLEGLMSRCGLAAVDLLKMDCEGAEWDILPAAESVLPRVRQVAMEFHCERGWTSVKLAEWLRARGFTVRHTRGAWNGLLWATREPTRAVGRR